jgi:hypothetical protein
MRKSVSSLIATLALAGLASACAAELPADEQAAAANQAASACSNAEGANAMLAALAVGMAQELGRWKIGTDLKLKTCTYNQQCMELTSAGFEQCRIVAGKPVGTPTADLCKNVKAILALQDANYHEKFIFPDGTKLNSYTFASRLVAGWDAQRVCESRPGNASNPNNCPAEEHKLTLAPNGVQPGAPGACDTNYTFNAKTPSGGNLQYPSLLKNKLIWTGYQGNPIYLTNPFIAFQSTQTTVTIDPTYGVNPPEQQTGGSCVIWPTTSRYSSTLTAGQCCKKTETSNQSYIVQTSPNMYKCNAG